METLGISSSSPGVSLFCSSTLYLLSWRLCHSLSLFDGLISFILPNLFFYCFGYSRSGDLCIWSFSTCSHGSWESFGSLWKRFSRSIITGMVPCNISWRIFTFKRPFILLLSFCSCCLFYARPRNSNLFPTIYVRIGPSIAYWVKKHTITPKSGDLKNTS
jgi:hypothetical protein